MKGKELLRNHDPDEARMLKHIVWTKEQIRALEEYIPKKEKQLTGFKAELKKLEEMTVIEWVKAHS